MPFNFKSFRVLTVRDGGIFKDIDCDSLNHQQAEEEL